jgi:hypothetical protein
VKEAIDNQNAGRLIDLIFDRLAAIGTSMMTLTSCGGLAPTGIASINMAASLESIVALRRCARKRPSV